MRAKMMGKAEEAAQLEAQLSHAKAQLAASPPPPPPPPLVAKGGGGGGRGGSGDVEVGVPNEFVGVLIGKDGASTGCWRRKWPRGLGWALRAWRPRGSSQGAGRSSAASKLAAASAARLGPPPWTRPPPAPLHRLKASRLCARSRGRRSA